MVVNTQCVLPAEVPFGQLRHTLPFSHGKTAVVPGTAAGKISLRSGQRSRLFSFPLQQLGNCVSAGKKKILKYATPFGKRLLLVFFFKTLDLLPFRV